MCTRREPGSESHIVLYYVQCRINFSCETMPSYRSVAATPDQTVCDRGSLCVLEMLGDELGRKRLKRKRSNFHTDVFVPLCKGH